MNRNIELPRYLRIIHWFAAIFFALVSFILFQGCTKSVHTVYQDIYIPVSCDIVVPKRPKPKRDVVFMVADLTEYTKKLEIALRACVNPMETRHE